MYKRILVPLDGSKLAEQVIPYVLFLGKDLKAQVQILRVFDPVPPDVTDPFRGIYSHEVAATRQRHAQDYLDGVKAALLGNGLTVATAVEEGSPADQIVAEAEKEPDTLIAMSTHGRSGMSRWVLGSVTDKVLHATPNPLLIIRSHEPAGPTQEVKLDTVIVPLDGSELSEMVLPHVVALASPRRWKVVLARVTPSAGEYYRYMSVQTMDSASKLYYGPYEEFSKEADALAMEYLHRVRENLMKERVASVEERLLQGHPAEALVDLACDTPDCLIAMTTHGRSGVGRWMLGSVADRVVRYSMSPVLVIRPPGENLERE